MMVDPFISILLRQQEVDERDRRYREQLAQKTLRPSEDWINRYISAYPSMENGDTLDEKMSSLLSRKFAVDVVLASYGKLALSKKFKRVFPIVSARLQEIYSR